MIDRSDVETSAFEAVMERENEGRVIHTFVIPGEPRPYHSWKAPGERWLRKEPPRRFVQMREYQETIRLFVASEWKRPPLTGLIYVGMDFHRGIPVSAPKTPAKQQEWARTHIGTRPDWDNYYKAALDALHGVLLADDSQVLGPGPLGGEKRYAPDRYGFTKIWVQEE